MLNIAARFYTFCRHADEAVALNGDIRALKVLGEAPQCAGQ